MMKKFNILVAALGTLGFMAQAEVGYDQSNWSYVRYDGPSISLGPTQSLAGPHFRRNGEPGIGFSDVYGGKRIGFSGMTKMLNVDHNGVYNMVSGAPGYTKSVSIVNFSKVPNADVYFGEWSYAEDGKYTHIAYYAGQDITTNMPEGGTATYTVKGISQYISDNPLSGTLTADFGEQTLSGSMSNTDMTLLIDADISSDGHFAGGAITGDDVGVTEGHFFGDNAASLAGYASFEDYTKDASFGGSKQ
ncbi:Slam-dependent surface lipoprotein [Xenorhabdus khoisanae]|uniref:Slam-dependent surface lipoprotein n=1 Tax=Xenorhabdus khoisanae TaxID=880157 RepID=UPI0032B7651F